MSSAASSASLARTCTPSLLKMVYATSDSLFLFTHRYSVGIFDNPYYRDQMFQLGLRPETAFGCGYDFLLYPQAKVQ